MARTRAAALAALFNLVSPLYAWGNAPAVDKKLVLWDACPKEQRPALFLFQGGRETYVWTASPFAKRTIEVALFIYLDASETEQGATINTLMDLIDGAFKPDATGKQTLGGTCEYCRIAGEVIRDPGDLDGDGLLMVPLQITLP